MFAPFAVSVTFCPIQIVDEDGDIVIVGNGLTVTVTCAVLVHVPLVPVIVYVVVVVGFAVTVFPVVALNPAAGLQL